MLSWSWGIGYCAQGQYNRADYYWHEGLHQKHSVEGWSFHSLQHPAILNAINSERFKKDFVGLCISACLHVGLMCIVCRNPNADFFFLHVCSTCSSHISANIYTGCKTLLISFPCLLSCSFSQPTLTLTFFHPDREWQEGGDKQSEGQKKSKWARGEVRRREEKGERHVVREKRAGALGVLQCDGWDVILQKSKD